jgi:tetratricopeptide (TPR) repeat protein
MHVERGGHGLPDLALQSSLLPALPGNRLMAQSFLCPRRGEPMRAIILSIILLLAATALAIAAGPDECRPGAKVMPKLSAAITVGDQTIHDFTRPLLPLPWTVRETDGEWLSVGGHQTAKFWVERSQVVTLDEAPGYYTQLVDSKQYKSDQHKALAYTYRAAAWKEQGDLDKAIADFGEAIRLDPNSAIAYSGRGRAWNEKNDPDKAIADLSHAIRVDSNSAVAYSERGIAWKAKKRLDEATADFDKAVRLDPKNKSAFLNLLDTITEAPARQSDFASAMQLLQKAIPLAVDRNDRDFLIETKKRLDRFSARLNDHTLVRDQQ